MYGGSSIEDACGSIGQIKGIKKHGDGFVSVRSGPDTVYKRVDKIVENGVMVNLCDRKGKWIGVVYGKQECRVHSPRPKRRPYKGKCRSGWIYGKYVDIIAG